MSFPCPLCETPCIIWGKFMVECHCGWNMQLRPDLEDKSMSLKELLEKRLKELKEQKEKLYANQ
jgi:hypothetical protein